MNMHGLHWFTAIWFSVCLFSCFYLPLICRVSCCQDQGATLVGCGRWSARLGCRWATFHFVAWRRAQKQPNLGVSIGSNGIPKESDRFIQWISKCFKWIRTYLIWDMNTDYHHQTFSSFLFGPLQAVRSGILKHGKPCKSFLGLV